MKDNIVRKTRNKIAAFLASTTILFGGAGSIISQPKTTPVPPSKNEPIHIPIYGSFEQNYNPDDFRHYAPMSYNKGFINDNRLNPMVYIVEPPSSHMEHTSRTAYGVSRRLGAIELSGGINVVAIPHNIENDLSGPFARVIATDTSGYPIVSHSMGYSYPRGTLNAYQGIKEPYTNENVRRVDAGKYIFYHAAGNNGDDGSRVEVDGVTFFLQNITEEYHHPYSVRVGGVSSLGNGTLLVEDYSSLNPTFCAALPYNGRSFYRGTSFSSPAAAAVERHLADIFGRSAALPDGVIHEDILMALMLSADTGKNLIRYYDGSVATVFNNAAGLPMTLDCGAGVIQPQKAADLLEKMVRWTRENPEITPTKPLMASVEISDEYRKVGDKYEYTVTVPESGTVLSVRAGLPFKVKEKGAAMLRINGKEGQLVLDLSPAGLTTDFRLAGYKFNKGDTITITTTKPLLRTVKTKPFVSFNMAAPGSPIERAVQERVAELKAPPAPGK